MILRSRKRFVQFLSAVFFVLACLCFVDMSEARESEALAEEIVESILSESDVRAVLVEWGSSPSTLKPCDDRMKRSFSPSTRHRTTSDHPKPARTHVHNLHPPNGPPFIMKG